MPRPPEKSGADQLMDIELLIANLEHCQATGTPFDIASYRPQMREAAVRSAWRVLDRSRFNRIISQLGDEEVS